MQTANDTVLGPILFLDEVAGGRLHLAALFVAKSRADVPLVETADGPHVVVRIAEYPGQAVFRARFTLPATGEAAYRWNGETFPVEGDLSGDMRMAYVSCNGEEVGDLDREGSERNAMWARLRQEHCRRPFSLLLHGGDQVYADEVTRDHPLSERWPEGISSDPPRADLMSLRDHLRQGFLERYMAVYRAPEFGWVAARVPSLMQWDDHDICDGWGSLSRSRTSSPVGQTLFAAARESFLTFQHAASEGDLPGRFADPSGRHLGWVVNAPQFRILSPDLRSERTRRRIIGPGGWAMMETEAGRDRKGHSFLMSSVPLLGPRLSLLEALLLVIPRMQKYEDDLRDQWQSRAHRKEWERLLRLVSDMALQDGHDFTALSGEIHLATRATLELGAKQRMHQLVASGIAHRAPPRVWANVLGALASLGDQPLSNFSIRIDPLPGHRARYLAQRNFLILERTAGAWQASWELEDSGRTVPLSL